MRRSRLSVILPPYCTSDTMYWKVDQLYTERDKFQRIFCRGTQYNYCAKEMCTTLEHPVTALEHPPDIITPNLMGPLYRCFSRKRIQAVRSPLLYSYGMHQPRGPNFRRS